MKTAPEHARELLGEYERGYYLRRELEEMLTTAFMRGYAEGMDVVIKNSGKLDISIPEEMKPDEIFLIDEE